MSQLMYPLKPHISRPYGPHAHHYKSALICHLSFYSLSQISYFLSSSLTLCLQWAEVSFWSDLWRGRLAHKKRWEEARRPGEAVLQGLLRCRLHISELQSSLILQHWVTDAPLPSPCRSPRVHTCLQCGLRVRVTASCTVTQPRRRLAACVKLRHRGGGFSASPLLSCTAARNTHQTATRISQKALRYSSSSSSRALASC